MTSNTSTEHDDADHITAELGSRLREVRHRRRESLAVIAERANLTRGFVSKVENGQSAISMSALIRLCSALEIELTELLAWPAGRLITVGERRPLAFGGTGLREYLLTPSDEHRIQVHLTEIDAGGGSGDEPYELPVEVEFATVLKGQLEVWIAETPHTLAEGDSLTFASAPHSFRNPGPGKARVLWVLAPALRDQSGAGPGV